MFEFTLNNRSVISKENKKLLEFLREDMNITSVKNGCSEGACGTCMIIVDGKAMKACVFTTQKLVGKNIITIEGMSERERDVYAYSFASQGAVQCGFCIPGMVISAKALLDINDNPTEEEIKKALRGNICRCTGYVKIIKAIELAAKILRENIDVPKVNCKGLVGDNFHRVDAVAKTLGTAEYVDDIRIEGMTYGSAVRTKYPRALIKKIDIEEAKKYPGVITVLTAKDIPGSIKVGHLKKDWDTLIPEGEITRYLGDAIVLVAAETKEALEEAKKLVKIDYEELTPMTCPEDALKEDAPKIHETGNILVTDYLSRGSAEEKIRNSKHVVTRKYSTPFTEHAFLEPECAVAGPYGKDGVIIYSTDQGVFATQHECADMLGLSHEKVRVINKMVGGGFGGKEDMSVQHHAALLAYHTKRFVKVLLTRKESIIIHPKRHATEMEFTTACDENGYLTAMKATIISDTGAYASLGGPVLQRLCTHAAGPYNYQDIDITGTAVYTNNPPGGAFRGFGVTQSCFATECNLNLLAEMVGISPWEIRYRNAIRPGQVLPNGQIADEGTAIVETLEAVKEEYEKYPYAGIACAMKNSGIGVGIPDVGRCKLKIIDGKVHIRTSASCIGQGLGTVMTQMVCEAANIRPEYVIHEAADTHVTPDSGNTTASRQTVFTGEATKRAAEKLREALSSNKTLKDLDGEEFYGEYASQTDKMGCDKENPVSHVAYGYATQVAVLNEDGKLKKMIAAHDVGKAINPISLEGQIEGGVVMSVGYALTEDYPLENSIPKAKFGTLGLFKSTEIPEVKAIVVEKNKDSLAYGAKGVGEICSIPTAPAIQNAYYLFDREFRTQLPLSNTPYRKK
ncbi:selenium-dependent xanthine dehydrogenase [Romboutsia weinsteinii]|uniref:Selenium-dependent xanthine dehydrogenase n=1 Tax=Romboutsia weinsteinii TaxID=2020949 RepID=A0A371J0T6_9FIRM|nr:selenium-dependent xanthine dehydrogenase [Romboutsia weinsteinii]RDY26412.1 selenium-dependent xanthine dehydrogenase [Romboutsia weinsteinii]